MRLLTLSALMCYTASSPAHAPRMHDSPLCPMHLARAIPGGVTWGPPNAGPPIDPVTSSPAVQRMRRATLLLCRLRIHASNECGGPLSRLISHTFPQRSSFLRVTQPLGRTSGGLLCTRAQQNFSGRGSLRCQIVRASSAFANEFGLLQRRLC